MRTVTGAAALWSLVYGGLAVAWTLGWRTFPYGGAEDASLFAAVPAGILAGVLPLCGHSSAKRFDLWVLWGLGLGAATLAYCYRTRGRCGGCDRDD
jgi:hypothetical protein